MFKVLTLRRHSVHFPCDNFASFNFVYSPAQSIFAMNAIDTFHAHTNDRFPLHQHTISFSFYYNRLPSALPDST
jgi:hypothetical protein